MKRFSSPTTVPPRPPAVPRWTVENSRKMFRFPIVRRVSSPRYLRSCGSKPTTANGKMRFSSPIVVGPCTFAGARAAFAGPLPERAHLGLEPQLVARHHGPPELRAVDTRHVEELLRRVG